jgi:hypothetical protein
MKLIFTKDSNNEISVQLTKGTFVETFSYTEMIKQLIKFNKFEDTEFNNINEEEQKRIETMLQKINEAIEVESQKNDANNKN